MKHLPRNVIASHAQEVGMVIDHLVAALGSDAGCTMRRAQILTDIDANEGTTQTAVMRRLESDGALIDKSTMIRDIDWLYSQGCIRRDPGQRDAREIELRIVGYAKTQLAQALRHFDGSHQNLQNFLLAFIKMFRSDYRPTLRDAKIVATVGDNDKASRKAVLNGLYQEPATTENRALGNLVSMGLLEEQNG